MRNNTHLEIGSEFLNSVAATKRRAGCPDKNSDYSKQKLPASPGFYKRDAARSARYRVALSLAASLFVTGPNTCTYLFPFRTL